MTRYAVAYTLSSSSHKDVEDAIVKCSGSAGKASNQNTLWIVSSSKTASDLRQCIRKEAKLRGTDYVFVLAIAFTRDGKYIVSYD